MASASAGSSLEGIGQITPESLAVVAPSVYIQLDEFARGGLGRIIRAKDTRTGRIVAIKEMLSSTEDAALRFAREAMITANLQHPAIVPVYEVGRWTNGQPFYAMKLVSGRPLDQVIATTKTIDDRLALVSHVLAVADALAYAHGERVIHRDLKPHNVLVGAHGETVVIDWGLARRLDEKENPASSHRVISAVPGQTYVGAIMGTPAYMPPEQARGVRVDERADVYAIGAILYHLLAGKAPYAGKTLDELLARVKEGKLARLTTVDPSIPADLAAIVERAMAREPAERYSSAADLAADVRRFTTGQLVSAHRYTRMQRLGRFVSRNRAAVVIASAAIITGAVGGTAAVRNVMTARDDATAAQVRAESARDEVKTRLVEAHVDRARAELAAGHDDIALAFALAGAQAGGLDDRLRFIAGRALASRTVSTFHEDRGLLAMAPVPGSSDFILTSDKEVFRWDPIRNQKVWTLGGGFGGDVLPLDDKTVAVARPRGIDVIDVASGKVASTLGPPGGDSFQGIIGLDPTKRWLAGPMSGGRLGLVDLSTRSFTAISAPAIDRTPLISPDAQRFVFVGKVSAIQSQIVLLDRRSGVQRELCSNCSVARHLGKDVIIAELGNRAPARVRILDWSGAQLRELAPGTTGDVTDLISVDGGQRFAFSVSDGTLEIHDRDAGLVWRRTMVERPNGLVLDSQRRLWVFGTYKGVYAFDIDTGMPLGRWSMGGAAVEVSSDGQRISILTLSEGVTSLRVDMPIRSVAPSPARVRKLVFVDNDTYVTGSEDGLVAVTAHGKVRELGRHEKKVISLELVGGTKVLSSGRDDKTFVRDLATGAELARADVGPYASASPDGTTIILGSPSGEVFTWDMKAAPRSIGRLPSPIANVRWTRDGSRFAAIDEKAQVDLWTRDGTHERTIAATDQYALDVAFSPSGAWLSRSVNTPEDVVISLVEGVPDVTLANGPRGPHYSLVFKYLDDERLLVVGGTGSLRVWELPSGKHRTLIEDGTDTLAIVTSPDEKLLVSGGVDRRARVWDPLSGLEYTSVATPNEIYGLSMSNDGTRLGVLTLGAGLVWDITPFRGDLAELERLAACRLEVAVIDSQIVRRTIDAAACATQR